MVVLSVYLYMAESRGSDGLSPHLFFPIQSWVPLTESNFNYLPKVLPLNSIELWIMISTDEFLEDTDIQCIMDKVSLRWQLQPMKSLKSPEFKDNIWARNKNWEISGDRWYWMSHNWVLWIIWKPVLKKNTKTEPWNTAKFRDHREGKHQEKEE